MIKIIIVSVITAFITGVITFFLQKEKVKAEFRTEFMAEQAVRKLLQSPRWRQRSFSEIRKRIGGFADDELRKILVRSGAVKFEGQDDKELWGLIDKNPNSL
jgi:hypothetical protein